VHTRYETEHDLHDLHEAPEHDREISLGTTTILGIFFALALLCAVFFGFGYSLGRRSASPVAAPSELTTGSTASSSKPASGNPASPVSPTISKPSADTTQSAIVPMDSPGAPVQDSQPAPSLTPVSATVSTAKADKPGPATNPGTKLIPTLAAPSSGSPVVQVAAMSHQEDADVVAADLKRRGYTVAIRHEPQDKLFHVQIGPFPVRKEADAMRQRLQADGYNNALVK
jgi:cell division septation protein DedD